MEQCTLSKFANIEIKNDTRVATDDLAFCESNQRLYLKVLKNYQNIYNDLLYVLQKEKSQFEEIELENTFSKNGYSYKRYDYHFLSINKEDFTEVIYGVHKIFIITIVDYFVEKYGVKLDVKSVDEILGIEKPKQVDYGCWGYRNFTDEEIKKINERNREYGKSLDKYRDKVITAKIDFNTIIDDIFIQLDGYSFVDKVKKEIIDSCKSACFSQYKKSNYAELKKNKISIETGFNSHFDGIWKEYEASTNNSDFRAIMRALSFFDSGENNISIYDNWYCSFIYYNKKERDGIYGLHSAYGNKVESFKFYKNGKWEVKFISEEEAKEFFDIYCKLEV